VAHFTAFANKTDFVIDETLLAYKVFLCYDLWQQYCRKVSGLSNGATMLAENVTIPPNILPQY